MKILYWMNSLLLNDKNIMFFVKYLGGEFAAAASVAGWGRIGVLVFPILPPAGECF
jgi:hypothetical protein